MSGYEIEELERIEDALDALESPTSEDVFQATRPFDERAIASVAAQRAGAGSQPVEWTFGPDGDLTIQLQPDTTVSAIKILAAENAENIDMLQIRDSADSATYFGVDGAGVCTLGGLVIVNPAGSVPVVDVDAYLVMTRAPFISGVWDAPDDGFFSPGDLAFWFDKTDGAAKLKIKAKSADGTVVNGEIPLT